jgi:hypothetical protein
MTPSVHCAECRALIGGYVLDALEPHEADGVRRHLADCRDCAAEHARLAELPALLALTDADDTAAEQPPDALEEAVLDRFAREHRGERQARSARGRLVALGHRLRRPVPAALAGAAAAAAATAVIALPIAGGGEDSSGHTYHAWLDGTAAAPTANANAKLETTSSGTAVELHVRGVPARPGDVYELWCIRDDGTKISAGTFRVEPDGRGSADLTTAARLGEYRRMSVERVNPARAESGEPVMAGDIQY